MKLFSVELQASKGADCDCCVVVTRCNADVFAAEQRHVESHLRALDPLATIKVLEVTDCGDVPQVTSAGVKVNSSRRIYEGYCGNAPA